MEGSKVYFDTNIFIYFLETDEKFFEVCAPFFKAVEDSVFSGCCGDAVICELLVKPMESNNLLRIKSIKSLFGSNGYFTPLSHTREIFEMTAFIRATQRLKFADAIHIATAIDAGCTHFVTHDKKIVSSALGIKVIDIAELV